MYLTNEGSLAEANQACNQNQLIRQARWCSESKGTAKQALVQKQSQPFGDC